MTEDIVPVKLDLPTARVPTVSSLPRGRLTVTQSVYCQIPGMAPFQLSKGFSRWISESQQVYSRTITVGEDWVQLPNGWGTGEVGHLVIENGQDGYERQPTREDRAASEAKVVEVGYGAESGIAARVLFLVPPGESMRVTPVNVTDLWVRCRRGSTQVTIVMVPK